MPHISPGRFTAEIEAPFIVFLIGMRVNKLWAVHQWVPTARAMPPMLRALANDPDSGFLGNEVMLYSGGVAVLQYWRSTEDLERFAKDHQEPHLSAWKRFNRALGNNGNVGIWHETFKVAAGDYESIYVNMPRFGLAAATAHVPVGRRGNSARERLAASGLEWRERG